MAASSSSRSEKFVLQACNNITFDVHEVVIEYCKGVVTQPPIGENDVDLKAFVSALVNDERKAYLDSCRYVDERAMIIQALGYSEVKTEEAQSMRLRKNPTATASPSLSSAVKVVLQSIDGKTFEMDKITSTKRAFLSLTCENVLDMIKRKDPVHIHKLFNITMDPQKKRKGYEALIYGLSRCEWHGTSLYPASLPDSSHERTARSKEHMRLHLQVRSGKRETLCRTT
ncbi:hypothetical protein M9H77_06913 [Catharanthus roseus]|uniref:Uncharacterized protein n=1 Tax=Catharanthus roseus TaxID=4058 RepID=A0ACC0BTP4_CATRO|nr:hypothetical protein M9H77_06913 [Catharanthus roseus]